MNFINNSLFTLLCVLLLSSCMQEVELDKISSKYSDDIGVAIPAVRSHFTLKDVIAELSDSTEVYDDDAKRKRIRFVHTEDPLIDINLSDIYFSNVADFDGSVKISDMTLPHFLSFNDSVTIKDIIDNMEDPGARVFFESISNGSSSVVFSIPTPGYNIGTFKIWETEGVKSVVFEEGDLNIVLNNHLPFPVSMKATFNDNKGNLLVEQQIADLAPLAETGFTIDISGIATEFPVFITISDFTAENTNPSLVITEKDGVTISSSLDNVVFESAELKLVNPIVAESVDTLEYSGDGKEISIIEFNKGKFNYEITNYSEIDEVKVELMFPMASTQNGTLLIVESLPKGVTKRGVIDLTNANFRFLNPDNNTAIVLNTKVYASPTADTIQILALDSIYGKFTITDIDLKSGAGWFGKDSIDIDEAKTELWLDLFDNNLDNISILNPQFKFSVRNTFGTSLDLKLNMRGYNSDGTKEASVVIPPLFIAQPPVNGISVTDFIVNRANTEGIVDLVNLPPAEVYHSSRVIVNPENVKTLNYFGNQSRLSIGMRFEVPFEFKADSFITTDTVEIEWPEDTEDLYPRILTVAAIHNLPFTINYDFILQDINHLSLDTLTGTVVEPADSDEFGFSTDSIITNTGITLSEEESLNFKNSAFVVLKATFYTGSKLNVRDVILQATDFADIQIGIKGIYKTKDN